LQKELDAKQQLELEIEKLKGQMKVRHHIGGGDDESAEKEKIEGLKEELHDKIEGLEYIEELNKGLAERESKARDEVEEARKELIQVSISIYSFQEKKKFLSENYRSELPHV
jgi:hypothetical protein